MNSVGTGVPTTGGQTVTNISATNQGDPFGFALSPDSLTLYVADGRSITSGGGIIKYTRTNTSSDFTLSTTFGTGSTVGARGLAVDYTGANPVLYAVTGESSANRLITFSDVAGVQTDFTVIATASAGEIFRGVAVIPVPEPSAILALGSVGLGLIGLVRRQRTRLKNAR